MESFISNLSTKFGDGVQFIINNPENVGIYVGTAVAIIGAVGALKFVRFKVANSVFKSITLKSVSNTLAIVLGVLTAFLNLQPLSGTENVLYPIALVPTVKVLYLFVKGFKDWLAAFGERKAAQEILMNNTLLNQPPVTEQKPTEPTNLF